MKAFVYPRSLRQLLIVLVLVFVCYLLFGGFEDERIGRYVEKKVIRELRLTGHEVTPGSHSVKKPINLKWAINRAGIVRNRRLIENLLENNVNSSILVILVQVHSRVGYLKALIDSLAATRHVSDTLLIFSHDVYDIEINRLVDSIHFAATIQIFYPYSMQLYPFRFPGQHACDCPKNMKKAE